MMLTSDILCSASVANKRKPYTCLPRAGLPAVGAHPLYAQHATTKEVPRSDDSTGPSSRRDSRPGCFPAPTSQPDGAPALVFGNWHAGWNRKPLML